MPQCSTCAADKPVEAFEKAPNGQPRRECKVCRAARRKEALKKAARPDPTSVPRPAACDKCGKGPDQVEFKWRTDVQSGGWRSECNECFNAKGYSQASRQRQMERDPVGYRKRNAEAHLEWARKNPEAVRAQRVKQQVQPDRRFKALVTAAKARGIDVEMGDRTALTAKLSQPCHYCAFVPAPGEPLNGLDRVDSGAGYTDANTVACCATCNAMKAVMSPDQFVHGVRTIAAHIPPQDGAQGGRAELRSKEADKRDELTVSQKIALWSSECYLCGQAPALGIDRLDVDGHYTEANTRPCCADCNHMKNDMSLADFCSHVARVAAHTASWVLRTPQMHLDGIARNAVSAISSSGSVLITFPSAFTAATVLGTTPAAISYALGAPGNKCAGREWRRADPVEYRRQRLTRSAVSDIILAMRAACRSKK